MDIGSFISQFGWRDAIDIGLVFLVIYRLLLLMRGTRAIQVLMGLGVLSLAFIVSDWLRLFVFNYLLRQLFEYVFIIVVVLFQDEIRRALANIGKNPFLSGSTEKNKALRVIEEICKASQHLAKSKTGALIVIERQHGLKNYTEGAVTIDAEVTAELLISIFHPSSPIHDGAIVIQYGRIQSAGCFVPVTLETSIDRKLGTRHRAAMGVTLETDAVVVVMSEERGEIAYAEHGNLTKGIQAKELREKLLVAFELIEKKEGHVLESTNTVDRIKNFGRSRKTTKKKSSKKSSKKTGVKK